MNRIEELKQKPSLACPKCGATAKVKVLVLKPGEEPSLEGKDVNDPTVPDNYTGGDLTLCPKCYTPFVLSQETGLVEITDPFVLIHEYALQTSSLTMWYRTMSHKTGRKNPIMEEVGNYIISMMNFTDMMVGWYTQRKLLNKNGDGFGFDVKKCGKEPCVCATYPFEQAVEDGLVVTTNDVGRDFLALVRLFPKHRPWTLIDMLYHMQTFTLRLVSDARENSLDDTSEE